MTRTNFHFQLHHLEVLLQTLNISLVYKQKLTPSKQVKKDSLCFFFFSSLSLFFFCFFHSFLVFFFFACFFFIFFGTTIFFFSFSCSFVFQFFFSSSCSFYFFIFLIFFKIQEQSHHLLLEKFLFNLHNFIQMVKFH